MVIFYSHCIQKTNLTHLISAIWHLISILWCDRFGGRKPDELLPGLSGHIPRVIQGLKELSYWREHSGVEITDVIDWLTDWLQCLDSLQGFWQSLIVWMGHVWFSFGTSLDVFVRCKNYWFFFYFFFKVKNTSSLKWFPSKILKKTQFFTVKH